MKRRPLPRLDRPSPVEFRFQSPADRDLPVELYGDFVHWFLPQRLEQKPTAAGQAAQFATTLSLAPGVYAYKFRTLDGRWHLDADNGRTRTTAAGQQNSLLVLGGSDEPILHAPRPPFLYRGADGRLGLRAGLRRGHGETLFLHSYDSEGELRQLPLRRLALCDEPQHLFFATEIDLSGPFCDYVFVLADGRRVGRDGCGAALRVSENQLPPAVPDWWARAVVYTIFVDRFRRSDGKWPSVGDEKARYGGDLAGVQAALPYLQDLGINVLHLTPIVDSPSAHRYDARNPLSIDPALGGEQALGALVAEADRRGIRLIADLVHTHVHRDFLPFCDVRLRGASSPFADWFYLLRHPFSDHGDGGPDPGYAHYQKGQWQEPLLCGSSPPVIDYLCRVAARYVELGFSGLRIDAASDAPLALLQRLRAAVGSDVLLLGEVTTDNPVRYTGSLLHAATDFAPQRALAAWLVPPPENTPTAGGDCQSVVAELSRAALARGAPESALIFTATHDQPRFLTRCGDAPRARLAQLITLLMAPVPAIYYGDEIGLAATGTDAAGRDFDDAWPDRAPFPWSPQRWDASTLALVQSLLRLRARLPALHAGQEEFLRLADAADVLAFRRRHGDEVVDVYVHRGAFAANANANAADDVRDFALAAEAASGATLLFACGDAHLQPQSEGPPRLRLSGASAAVVARHAPAEAETLWHQLAGENRVAAQAAFRHGATSGLFLPTHLYLTVTERCNLRCQHCITDAPQRTQEGRARSMQPWLMDALAPAFSAADYFAFVHGGESLLSPLFFPLLQRIAKARAGRPYDVHLLSNGMLLSPDVVSRLLAHGVSSLSISLDGGSSQTNDALRQGADFARILRNLSDAVALRQRLRADLRIGVSVVLTRDNYAELPALARRLADLGIDWLKLEEMYPVNLIAIEQLVDPQSRVARATVAALRAELAELGSRLLLVDHLQDDGRCPCALAEEHGDDAAPLAESDCAACAFRSTDDFANRTQFHPCRVDWQQACIDPDGTVHPGDYGQPAIGSLADASLLSLWQGAAMQKRRAVALGSHSPWRRSRCQRGGTVAGGGESQRSM